MKTILGVAVFVILGSAIAEAQGDSLGIKYRGWRAGADGSIKKDKPAIAGTRLSADAALGLDDEELFHDLTIWGNLPFIGNARLNLWQGDLSGSETVATPFTFSGDLYGAGTRLSTDMEFQGASLLYDYPLAQEAVGSGYVEAALQVGYSYYWVLTQVSGGGESGQAAISAPSLSGGIRIFTQMASWLWADVQFLYDAIDLKDDVDSGTWMASAEFLLNPLAGLFVGLGYRRIDYDIQDERQGSRSEASISGKLDGWLFSISYQF